MREVTIYEANDGTRWRSVAEAVRRDALLDVVAEASAALGPHPPPEVWTDTEYRSGYVQHTAEAVAEARQKVGQIVGDKVPGLYEELSDPRTFSISSMADARLLQASSTACVPLQTAHRRLENIDDSNREWSYGHLVKRTFRPDEVYEIKRQED